MDIGRVGDGDKGHKGKGKGHEKGDNKKGKGTDKPKGKGSDSKGSKDQKNKHDKPKCAICWKNFQRGEAHAAGSQCRAHSCDASSDPGAH